MTTDQQTTVAQLRDVVRTFVTERNWEKFHAPKNIDEARHPHKGPPSISVGFAAATENDTKLFGGAHSGVWKDDHLRYLGAIAGADVNLKFYPDVGPPDASDEGIRFNIDGEFLYQQLQYRLKESNWWLGGNYLYINAKNTFDLGDGTDGLPGPLSEFEQGGLGFFVQYDGRDTVFTPTRGLNGRLEYRNYDKSWGSDFDFDHFGASLHHHTPFGEYSSLGLRLDGEAPALDRVPGISDVHVHDGVLTCQLEGDPGPLLAALQGTAIRDLLIEPARLEEAFMEYYAEDELDVVPAGGDLQGLNALGDHLVTNAVTGDYCDVERCHV